MIKWAVDFTYKYELLDDVETVIKYSFTATCACFYIPAADVTKVKSIAHINSKN